jgi:hypothetical protein
MRALPEDIGNLTALRELYLNNNAKVCAVNGKSELLLTSFFG